MVSSKSKKILTDADVLKMTEAEYMNDDQKEFLDRKSTRLNSSHVSQSRMPSSA